MNKRLKSISCALAVTLSLVVVENTVKFGPLGVDIVSAATEATTTSTGSSSSSTSGNVSRILSLGSKGDDVKAIQTALNAKGNNLTVDGFYGNLTLNAVKTFQKYNGLTVDGIVGSSTLVALIPSSVVPKSTIKVGSRGNDVKYLQDNLNKLGYKLNVDGIFGSLTLDAVKAFQKDNGLVVDGISGPITFAKLFEKTTTPAVPTTPPIDTVTWASQVNDEATFEKNIKDPNSYYMLIVNKDLTFTKDLTVVSGTKPASSNATTGVTTPAAPNRSIAPCVEDLTTKQITKKYTITLPNLILSGMNEKVEDGIVKGNVYVQSTGFTLPNATINGNLYFANQALLDAYNQLTAANKGKVNGTITVKTN